MVDPALIPKLGTDPIAGAATPSGINVRYEPEFQQLEAEILKMESPGGGEINWKLVAENASQILYGKSKDLLVAAYLTRGLFQLNGYGGLAAGLTVCRDLVKNFWDTLFPDASRPVARQSALQWIARRFTSILASVPPTAADASHLASVTVLLQELATLFGEKQSGADTGLPGLASRIQEAASSAGAGGAPAADGSAASAAGAEASGPAPRGGASGPIASRAEAFKRLKEVADYFIRTEPHSPIGLLLARALTWGEMSFEQVFQELLKRNNDAQTHVWDVLGIKKAEGT